MGIEFNRIITLLRKERGITQKQAAQDLGISQAQLSHYEKGIRECGLAFVVQVADYYDVSCDYLLGRSAERSGQTITVEELPEAIGQPAGECLPRQRPAHDVQKAHRELPRHPLRQVAGEQGQAACCRRQQLPDAGRVQDVPAAVRGIAQKCQRHVPRRSARWDHSADAAMSMAEGDLAAALTGEDGTRDSLEPATLALSTDQLARDYPRHATSLFNLVKNAEEAMRGLKKGGVKPKIRACAVRLHSFFCISGDITGRAGLTCPVPCGRRGRRICRGAARRREKCHRRKRSCPARGTCA